MSDEDRISFLREKAGYDAKKKGESLHSSASKEFKRGFGSNVQPKNFGRTGNPTEWECVCGYTNSSKRRIVRGNEELCWNCYQLRDFVDIERIAK